MIRVGTAGWGIPRQQAARFEGKGTALERYARVMRCAEINSTFYRSHRAGTYARWAASVPEEFRFAVKASRTITHECGLAPPRERVRGFLAEVRQLGERLGPVLFQLPPKQGFDERVARAFFAMLREEFGGDVVVEPRQAGWFGVEAEAMMRELRIGRVAADPAIVPEAARPGGDEAVVYWRLHGSPRMYYSEYAGEWLEGMAGEIVGSCAREVWCVFDNTASGAALGDALGLMERVERGRG